VIHDQYEKKVDIVIDGGLGNLYASTVLDCSEHDDIVVIREGLGSLTILD
jgi:tRNA A37 threonylcarbamoyladenosine synthetase subunit TsaC/SUA5/YrdC